MAGAPWGHPFHTYPHYGNLQCTFQMHEKVSGSVWKEYPSQNFHREVTLMEEGAAAVVEVVGVDWWCSYPLTQLDVGSLALNVRSSQAIQNSNCSIWTGERVV